MDERKKIIILKRLNILIVELINYPLRENGYFNHVESDIKCRLDLSLSFKFIIKVVL